MDVLEQSQAIACFYSFVLGFYLAGCYQVYYATGKFFWLRCHFRKNIHFKIKKILLFFWDVNYFIIISPICLVAMFGLNNGIVRWYFVFSAFLGYFLYSLTVNRALNYLYKMFKNIISRALELVKKRITKLLTKLMVK